MSKKFLCPLVPPKIAPFAAGTDPAFLGDYFTLQCSMIHGDQPINIYWLINGERITKTVGITVNQMGSRSSVLTIDAIGAEHAGNYTCVGKNTAGATVHSTDLIVNVPPLIVPFTFGEVPFNPGDAVQITCLATKGDAPLDISWTFSSDMMDSALPKDILTTPMSPRSSALMINSVTANHQGNYTCIVKNTAGRVEFAATLVVNVRPRIVPFDFESPIFAGQAAQVTCLVSEGDHPVDISWSFQTSHTGSQDGITTNKIGNRASLLLVDPADWGHSGNYTCTVRNPVGTVNFTASLEVNVLPEIEPFSFHAQGVNGGASARIMCTILVGDSPLSIHWLKNEEIIPANDKMTQRVDDYTSILSLRHVSLSDAGNYSCVVSNRAGETRYSAALKVKEVPQTQPMSFSSEYASEGDYAQLTCVVTKGDVPLNFEWFLNDEKISPSSGVNTVSVGQQTSLLIVQNVTSRHAGSYTCRTSNKAGFSISAASLVVKGKNCL